MELIKEAGTRTYKSGRTRKIYSFKCPVCQGEVTTEKKMGLKSKMCKKCADYSRAGVSAIGYKHGGRKTRLYKIWQSIKGRCYYIKTKSYNKYGGRGIKMCDEWRDDFTIFRDWAIKNGYKDIENAEWKYQLSIDRIDTNGNYEPSNCRWITLSENVIKSNTERQIEIDKAVKKIEKIAQNTGKSRKQICKELNFSYASFTHAKTRWNKNVREI